MKEGKKRRKKERMRVGQKQRKERQRGKENKWERYIWKTGYR